MDDKNELIKETIKDIFNLIKIEADVSIYSNKEDNLVANIKTEEAGSLIGQKGANLEALQHIIRLVVNKKQKDSQAFFSIDINNYKKDRSDLLLALAQSSAQRVVSEGVSLMLQPMPSFERRIIHLALSQYPEIISESVGEKDNPRIIIKPKP